MIRLKQIAISEENYFILKSFGKAADSFNDVLTELLKTLKVQQTDQSDQPMHQSVASKPIKQEGSWT